METILKQRWRPNHDSKLKYKLGMKDEGISVTIIEMKMAQYMFDCFK